MSIDKIPVASSAESLDPRNEALRNREAFYAEIDAVANINELVAVLGTYSYSDRKGEQVLPVFMQETEDYANTVPHDGVWAVAATVPLNRILVALTDYRQGHLSVQQLYFALVHFKVFRAVQRIIGVDSDADIQMKLLDGELPERGGEGVTVDAEAVDSSEPKALPQY